MWNVLRGTSHPSLFSLGCVKFKAPFCVWPPLYRAASLSCSNSVPGKEKKEKKKRQRRNALCTFNPSQALLSPSDLFMLCLWSRWSRWRRRSIAGTQTKESSLDRITLWLTERCWVSQRHLLDSHGSVFTPEAVGAVGLKPEALSVGDRSMRRARSDENGDRIPPWHISRIKGSSVNKC